MGFALSESEKILKYVTQNCMILWIIFDKIGLCQKLPITFPPILFRLLVSVFLNCSHLATKGDSFNPSLKKRPIHFETKILLPYVG